MRKAASKRARHLRAAQGRRARLGVLGVLVGLVVVAVASVIAGSRGLIVPTVFGGKGPLEDELLTSLRLPRMAAGMIVGGALAAAGLLVQSVTRNPLGDPGLLGVASGALLGGVLAKSVWGIGGTELVWPCIAGALAATAFVLFSASRRGPNFAGVNLILIGMAVNAVLGGAVAVITLGSPTTFATLRFWIAGSLAGRTSGAVLVALVLVIPALALTLLLHRQLDVLALGADRARSLGVRPEPVLAFIVLIVAWLVGTATALAGPIAFVGLAAPHLGRAIGRSPDHARLIILTVAIGAGLVTGADLVGRLWAAPGEVSVAIVCAIGGAPFLIAIGLRMGSYGRLA